jgi:predicted phosphodiesterase
VTKKILIVPDTHAPYHDEAAWALMLKVAKAFKPDIGIHIGDLHDCYAISSYPKDPTRQFNHDTETASARDRRTELDELEMARKIFCEGNHEDRLPRYLMKRAPELFSTVTTDKLLQLTENDWELVPYQDSIKVGCVYYTHDTGSGGKYPTRIALETFQHSVVVGHNHRMEYHVIGDATGDHQVGAQFGWLGDVDKVDYLHRIKVKRLWSLGFGLGYMDEKTGVTHLVPVPIVNYKVNVAGKEFKA